MAKDDVKSIKMDSDLKNIVNERIEKSGMEGAEWLESLMALEVIHRIRNDDEAVEHDLKDLEKFMNRIYHILIRIYQRGADSVEEIKERSMEEATRLAQELETLRFDFSQLQKRLTEKEGELINAYSTNSDLRLKMEQFEKTTKTVEELNRLTNEKVEQLQKQVDQLQNAERAAAEMKEELQDLKQVHAKELAVKKEEEAKLRQQLDDLQRESDHIRKQSEEDLARLLKEQEREFEVLRRELEMKARENLFMVKDEAQERINKLNELHSAKVAELIEKLQEKK